MINICFTLLQGILNNLREEKMLSHIVTVFSEVITQDVQGPLESIVKQMNMTQVGESWYMFLNDYNSGLTFTKNVNLRCPLSITLPLVKIM